MGAERTSQLPVEAAVSPTSAAARTSQEAVEAVVLPDDSSARTTQVPIEVVVEYRPARLSQEAVDVVVLPTSQKARVSQEAVDAVVLPTSQKARLSQEAVDAVVLPTSQKARLSQEAVDVVYRTAEIRVLGTQAQCFQNQNPNPLSVSHTAPPGTELLCVILTNDVDSGDDEITGTYGGVPASDYRRTSNKVHILWWFDPPTGTNQLVIQRGVSTPWSEPCVGIVDCSAGSPSVPVVAASAVGSSSPATVNISARYAGGIILFGVDAAWNDPGAGPFGTGQVALFQGDLGLDSAVASYELNTAAGSNPQTYAFSSIDPGWTGLAVWIAGPGIAFVPRVVMV